MPAEVNLPPRPFLYTFDQVADLMGITVKILKKQHVYFRGITVGGPSKKKMTFININEYTDSPPEWRVEERELIRFLRALGYKVKT